MVRPAVNDAPGAPQVRPVAHGTTAVWKPVERGLLLTLLLLKLHTVAEYWGHAYGYDASQWLVAFEHVHWMEPLPPIRKFFVGWHPPLSFLVTRALFWVYPHAVECSQIVSTVGVVGGVLLLRASLQHAGLLWTAGGVCFLYLAAGLPLLVWLQMETSQDALVFFFFMLTLHASVRLFWRPESGRHWGWRALLAASLYAGMMTKFSGAVAYGVPPLVLGVRRLGLLAWAVRVPAHVRRAPLARVLSQTMTVLVCCTVAGVPTLGFLYDRYYREEGKLMPVSMDWQRPEDLAAIHKVRDQDRVGFVLRLLKPEGPFTNIREPARDSVTASLWMLTFRKDWVLGAQSDFSNSVSDFYTVVFLLLALWGTLLFVGAPASQPRAWNHLGWVLYLVGAAFTFSLVLFNYRYPLFDWIEVKAKYVTAGLLWIPWAAAQTLTQTLGWRWRPRPHRWLVGGVAGCLLLWMCVNHLTPVY